MATGIITIEVIYTIPLLILIHFNGDTDIVINEDNPPFTNVRQYNNYYYTVPSRKRAHYGMSAHPPLWAQFPAKV